MKVKMHCERCEETDNGRYEVVLDFVEESGIVQVMDYFNVDETQISNVASLVVLNNVILKEGEKFQEGKYYELPMRVFQLFNRNPYGEGGRVLLDLVLKV